MEQSNDNPEVFTGEFIKTANTPWGVKSSDKWRLGAVLRWWRMVN